MSMRKYASQPSEGAKSPSLRKPPCPRCSRVLAQRTRCRGFFEHVCSLLMIYPFRCMRCGHRFRAKQRGVQYVRQPF